MPVSRGDPRHAPMRALVDEVDIDPTDAGTTVTLHRALEHPTVIGSDTGGEARRP